MSPMPETESFARGINEGGFDVKLDLSGVDGSLLENYHQMILTWEKRLKSGIRLLKTSSQLLELNAGIFEVAGLALVSSKKPTIAGKFGFQAVDIGGYDILLTPKGGEKVRLTWMEDRGDRTLALSLAGVLMILGEKDYSYAGQNGLLIRDETRVAVYACPSSESSSVERNLKLASPLKGSTGGSDTAKPILSVKVDFIGRP